MCIGVLIRQLSQVLGPCHRARVCPRVPGGGVKLQWQSLTWVLHRTLYRFQLSWMFSLLWKSKIFSEEYPRPLFCGFFHLYHQITVIHAGGFFSFFLWQLLNNAANFVKSEM